MALNASNAVDRMITIVIFATIAAAMVPIVLSAFTNLSTSGLVLATLFTTVGGILLAVAVFKGIQALLS